MLRGVVCACVWALALVHAAKLPDLQALVDAQYLNWTAQHPWIGIAVGIIHPAFDEPQFFSYGVQNGTGSLSVTPDTLFNINSMTKVFTALVLAEQANAGVVALDDAVQRYQPGVALDPQGNAAMELVDLASHWSGLPTRPSNLPNPDYINYTNAMFYDFMHNYNFPTLHVRKQYWYSNCAFGLLANVLADIEGVDFAHLMQSHIFDRVGMTRSDLATNTARVDARISGGHDEDGTPLPAGTSCEAVLGSWAVRSTARDVLALLGAHLAANANPPPQTPLAAAMRLAQTPIRATDDGNYTIGLGWRTHTATNTKLKTGSGDGFEAVMQYQVDKSVALVVLSNSYLTAPHDVDTTSDAIWQQLLAL